MRDKITLSASAAIGIAVVLILLSFAAGLQWGKTHTGFFGTRSADMPQDVDFSPVWQAWDVINTKFVPASVASTTKVASTTAAKNQEKVWGMIEGLAASLGDPYTFFLPPQQNEQFNSDMSGQFEGVGMEIDVKNQLLTVVAPLKGTPADRAG